MIRLIALLILVGLLIKLAPFLIVGAGAYLVLCGMKHRKRRQPPSVPQPPADNPLRYLTPADRAWLEAYGWHPTTSTHTTLERTHR